MLLIPATCFRLAQPILASIPWIEKIFNPKGIKSKIYTMEKAFKQRIIINMDPAAI